MYAFESTIRSGRTLVRYVGGQGYFLWAVYPPPWEEDCLLPAVRITFLCLALFRNLGLRQAVTTEAVSTCWNLHSGQFLC